MVKEVCTMRMNCVFLRAAAILLCICLLMSGNLALAADEETANPYPDVLKISIVRETWTAEDGRTCETALPVTANDEVNAQLKDAQQMLLADLLAHCGEGQTMEQEATYRISGTSWAGYYLVGRVVEEVKNPIRDGKMNQTMYVNHMVFTYDMETGEPLTLANVFSEDSPAWEKIAQMMKDRYLLYYPEETKDLSAIEPYCTYESLSAMPFLPSAGRLTITTPLEPALENRWQLVNTFIPYPDFRSMMNDEAAQQTDNSHRNIIAITYDDGPNVDNTPMVLRSLNNYGANSTFFTIGISLERCPDVTRQALDYGHTVGNHTYKHRYDFQVNAEYLREDRVQCLQLHSQLTGLEPVLFRAPGGNVDGYLKHKIGWPIILWRYSAGDTGNNNAYQLADRIFRFAKNGDIVLMHDLYRKTAKGTEMFLCELAENGYLFASVDELLYLYGIVPQPNTVYRDAVSPPETEPIK